MEKLTIDNLNKAKLGILNKPHSAFISSMLYNLNIKENKETNTIELITEEDGKVSLNLNSEWFNKLEQPQRLSSLVHETLHYALQHDIRRGSKEPELYQKACDQVVNNLLVDMGYELPEDAVTSIRNCFKNMSVDSVYKYMLEEQNNKNNQNNSDGDLLGKTKKDNKSYPQENSLGGDLRNTNNNNKPSPNIQNQRNSELNSAALADKTQTREGKNIGQTSSAFDSVFEDIKEKGLDWKTILFNYVDTIVQGEMSYRTFNRRYIPIDLYLPDNRGDGKIEKIALAFDVSGSVSEEEIKSFLAEIKKIKSDINPEVLHVVTFNSNIVEKIIIPESKDINKIKMKTSGGTNLEPVFEYYNKINPNFLIVFSDLECYPIEVPSKYPVIWVCINNPNATVNFGKLIHIKSEDLAHE